MVTTLPESSHYSLSAEQAVIGGLLLANEKWDEITPIVNESNFYLFAHKIIFSAIQSLCERNVPVDIITMEQVLKDKDKELLEQVGGLAYLAELVKNTPSISSIESYAHIVKRDSQVRQLNALGNTLRAETNKIYSQESLDDLIEQTEKALTEITLNVDADLTNVSVIKAMQSVVTKMERCCQDKSLVTGVPFGITQLDSNTSGAQSGELIILAARPSMGKTALSLCFANSALETINKPVQYYSLEMPAEQIMERLLAMRANLSLTKIRQAVLMGDEDWTRVAISMEYIRDNWEDRLLIDDSSYLTPQMLRTRVRRNMRKYGQPSIVIVDYLQLMSVPSLKNSQNRHLEISEISRSLKNLAKEIGCPVIALSQLNRNLEQRADKRPLNSDLRESGSLEQDADVLLFIYRDEVYHDNSDLPGIAEIIIGKQRNGPIGTIFSRFRGEYSRFDSIPEDEYERIKSK
ncbi:replicative DNA helicase [Ursidibacter maritimus]|uniref:replicative DNA helicase n=1 Tax=Ursidibacter maritimus TaxID=1331689 RepID=UPI001C45F9B3|nr:replicative DNA helicase [Ursidibacter maritimus]MBV6540771.1 replicative DNA helicase [Ursidibacter maritimus]